MNGLDKYPGLGSLVDATEVSAWAILPLFLKNFLRLSISRDHAGRAELAELVYKPRPFWGQYRFSPSVWPSHFEGVGMAVLRSELIAEFEKLGAPTSVALEAAVAFLDRVRKEEKL